MRREKRHTGQWGRIQCPEIHPNIYGQLRRIKSIKTTQWRKNSHSNKWHMGELGVHMQKNEGDPYLTSYTQINSK